ncbi:MAG: GntR family transcriptional regulator [Escherichia coli]|nr:GntR family transcriptional regulator [Escherichia coli]
MKSATSAQRPYQEVGAMIRDLIIKTPYNPGERLPPEREIAEMLDVTRTVVREALIMLEIKGLVEVRRGAGIYVLDNSGSQNTDSPDANVCNDAGPFELLQARQLLESNIAEFAALQATREDIVKMRQALQLEERELASSAPGSSESGVKKDARAAKLAMWQHLENVKQRLLEFSNVDDIYFDGYLFDSWPLDKVDA